MSAQRKSRVVKLSELAVGQFGDCFAQLLDKRAGTRDGKPFYSCRFRDPHRTGP